MTGRGAECNRFVSLSKAGFNRSGHTLVHTLDDSDIDLIVLTDPRVRAPNVAFGPGAILRYLVLKNPNAIVVHRINECDERKQEKFINARLVRANYIADATVFVGEWLSRLPVWREHCARHGLLCGTDRREPVSSAWVYAVER